VAKRGVPPAASGRRPGTSTGTLSKDDAEILLRLAKAKGALADAPLLWRLRKAKGNLVGLISWDRRDALGNREQILHLIATLCGEFARYNGGREDLLRVLFRDFVRHAGEEAARSFFGALASKGYSNNRREKEVAFWYEIMDPPSKSELIRDIFEINKWLPRDRRMASQSKIPGAIEKYVARVLKKPKPRSGK
jgi:hypothetical protein